MPGTRKRSVTMIERMPLDVFDDSCDSNGDNGETRLVASEDDESAVDVVIEPPQAADVLIVTCQWCSAQFDNELPFCPECNAKHVKAPAPLEEPTTSTCQWCLATFDIGPTLCPNCNGRVVIPGQTVPGDHDLELDFNRLGMASRRAQSNQLLLGLAALGGLDSIVLGLVGLAVTVLDDD